MYLRYREPSWESGDFTESQPRRRRTEPANSSSSQTNESDASRAVNAMPIVELHGIRLHAITERTCIAHLLNELDAGRGGVLVTPNLDHVRRYVSDVSFRVLVAEADLIVADGMPLVWASRLQGTPLPERVAGSNLISSLAAAAADRGRSVYFLGGSPKTAEGAARILHARHPHLKVAGWHTPVMGFENNPREMAAMIADLSAAKPDIVYVALGSPKQERLIARLKKILPGSWWLGVGNSFSFLCGDVKRAPAWMQKSGLEWVHRLGQEPRRLFKRYIATGIPFAIAMLGRSAMRGIPNRLDARRARWIAATQALAAASSPPRPTAVAAETLARAEQDTPSMAAALNVEIPPPAPESITEINWPSTGIETEPSDDLTPFSRLRAIVLLGGSVRVNALSTATGRSVLDLPLDEGGSILNFWLGQAAEVARMAGLDHLPVRVMVDQHSPEPRSAGSQYIGAYRVERDLSEYRGTGGVLCDICNSYQDDDLILIVNGAQVLLDPLTLVLTTLARKRGDVAVISHDDGTPSGIMLVTCKTLRLLPAQGFVDMKEQGLPLIAGKFDVRVVKRRRPTGLPIRSFEGYIEALHYYHRRRSGKPAIIDPLAEDWTPVFSLVEPGATVDASVRVHDSVVLAGGCVEPGAVLVRSVVCSGAVVRRDRTAVDQLIALDAGSGAGPKNRRKKATATHLRDADRNKSAV